MNRPLVVLAHGWGFAPSFWAPMSAALRGVETVAVDLGFRGPPSLPELPADRPLVGVGHSLGFAWLLRERPWDGLVAINGFPRFTRGEGFPEGVHPRLLDRMRSRLRERPAEVAGDFLRRCGVDDPEVHDLAPDRLAEGLDWLAEWDLREALGAHHGALLALAGDADPIVPEAMSRASFPAGCLRVREEAGHLLPWSHPEWCASELDAFLRGLS
ncbi:alpha/beta fold hydrolase [Vulgatibacter incomptus]|uniref:Biotin synthesis protein BioH n=1 Tax=Vulgatibacter incomptus TaxID=1391653 RepID=A0A0K1PF15_9BACT|nr:alpha/beta hydrolase [Vulgatibacter incomptus]AKU92011.1 Biotin synthesis protein BioH [Vulgatibacter incomptus]